MDGGMLRSLLLLRLLLFGTLALFNVLDLDSQVHEIVE